MSTNPNRDAPLESAFHPGLGVAEDARPDGRERALVSLRHLAGTNDEHDHRYEERLTQRG